MVKKLYITPMNVTMKKAEVPAPVRYDVILLREDEEESKKPKKAYKNIAEWEEEAENWKTLNKVHGCHKSIWFLSLKDIENIKVDKNVNKESWIIDEFEKGRKALIYIDERKELARYLIENNRRGEMSCFFDLFSDNLKKLRLRAELTQGQVANDIQVGSRTYQRWESGETKPDLVGLNKLLVYFQVSYEELIMKEL